MVGGGDSPISLAADRGPSSGRGLPTRYNIHFNNACADVNIQGILVSALVLSHLFLWEKIQRIRETYIFKRNENQEDQEEILNYPTGLHRAHFEALCGVSSTVCLWSSERSVWHHKPPPTQAAVQWPSFLRPTIFYCKYFCLHESHLQAPRPVHKGIFTSPFISTL